MVTDELLKQLDTKDYSVSEHKDAVTAIDADAWIDALDAGRLTTLMKLNLLDTVGMVTAMVRVVARLADQSDFGIFQVQKKQVRSPRTGKSFISTRTGPEERGNTISGFPGRKTVNGSRRRTWGRSTARRRTAGPS